MSRACLWRGGLQEIVTQKGTEGNYVILGVVLINIFFPREWTRHLGCAKDVELAISKTSFLGSFTGSIAIPVKQASA
ncbi:hypothetical protein GCM10007108_10070 [Thermogymnomonas acidicola]|uniref:Uncharacterized protein n=1 Tax=Thermogymnomonas acidicola TaxID=399579 RepID=A0AA37BRE5_9ARCH|nr:hypothetical protein GCM10007108_10070 [Thermogymnomonas acidicola]